MVINDDDVFVFIQKKKKEKKSSIEFFCFSSMLTFYITVILQLI